jgi:hypothetical protein
VTELRSVDGDEKAHEMTEMDEQEILKQQDAEKSLKHVSRYYIIRVVGYIVFMTAGLLFAFIDIKKSGSIVMIVFAFIFLLMTLIPLPKNRNKNLLPRLKLVFQFLVSPYMLIGLTMSDFDKGSIRSTFGECFFINCYIQYNDISAIKKLGFAQWPWLLIPSGIAAVSMMLTVFYPGFLFGNAIYTAVLSIFIWSASGILLVTVWYLKYKKNLRSI